MWGVTPTCSQCVFRYYHRCIQTCRLDILKNSRLVTKTANRQITNNNTRDNVKTGKFLQPFMELGDVINALRRLAPLELAESWDNVGLLLQPSGKHMVSTLLLTNDLTEEVLEEAVLRKAELIVSYHPPIFAALKRLTASNWKERCVLKCAENRIAIYSPHTSWDALDGGVNDWLAKAFGSNVKVQPITNSLSPQTHSHMVCLRVTADNLANEMNAALVDSLTEWVSHSPDAEWLIGPPDDSNGRHLRFKCSQSHLEHIGNVLVGSSLLQHLEVTKLEKMPIPGTGMGRLCCLEHPLSLDQSVQIIKKYLNLPFVRVALGHGKTMNETSIKKIALCAGSGSSILCKVSADLYWTGEMSHHDVLDANHKGTSVILCEHSNTERGFLKHVAPKLEDILENKVKIIIAERDVDPLIVQ